MDKELMLSVQRKCRVVYYAFLLWKYFDMLTTAVNFCVHFVVLCLPAGFSEPLKHTVRIKIMN